MGMTNPVYPLVDCGENQPGCETTPAAPEVGGAELSLVAEYLHGLTPPPRVNYEDPDAISGMWCHVAAKSFEMDTVRFNRLQPSAVHLERIRKCGAVLASMQRFRLEA